MSGLCSRASLVKTAGLGHDGAGPEVAVEFGFCQMEENFPHGPFPGAWAEIQGLLRAGLEAFPQLGGAPGVGQQALGAGPGDVDDGFVVDDGFEDGSDGLEFLEVVLLRLTRQCRICGGCSVDRSHSRL